MCLKFRWLYAFQTHARLTANHTMVCGPFTRSPHDLIGERVVHAHTTVCRVAGFSCACVRGSVRLDAFVLGNDTTPARCASLKVYELNLGESLRKIRNNSYQYIYVIYLCSFFGVVAAYIQRHFAAAPTPNGSQVLKIFSGNLD